MRLDPNISLGVARKMLLGKLGEGTHCPCCGQMAKRYRRKVTRAQVFSMSRMLRAGGDQQMVHMATYDKSREASKLAYWGLMIEDSERRPDGGKSGWWMITEKGIEFIYNRIEIPKYVWVYNNRVIKTETKRFVTVIDCVKTQFKYDELMAGL